MVWEISRIERNNAVSDVLPQLIMRRPHLDGLNELAAKIGPVPSDLYLHTHIPGQDAAWEQLVNSCFAWKVDFARDVVNNKMYHPSCIFYLADKNGKDVAVSAAVENEKYPGEGWLHYVAVDASARGRGLSKYVILAVLFACKAMGYHSCGLSTDDFRLPAIKTYLELGYEPVMSHESHPDRWKAIMENLDTYKK